MTKDDFVMVLDELKGLRGSLILRQTYRPFAFQAFVVDDGGYEKPLDRQTLSSLKPQMSSWIDCHLTKQQQDFLSQAGAHMRFFGRDQENAALLLRMIRQISRHSQ